MIPSALILTLKWILALIIALCVLLARDETVEAALAKVERAYAKLKVRVL